MDWESPPRSGVSFVDRLLHAPDDNDQGALRPAEDNEFHELPPDDETPLHQLIRHWMNERHAPDILPIQEDLLGRLLDHIRRQVETVQLIRLDPDTSEEEHFRTMLAQTEVERVKFIIRSYVRTRLFKIEKYARYIMTNEDVQERLSDTERQYAKRYADLSDNHFYHSVLQSLPAVQASLDDETPFMPPMITQPNKQRPVFVHARTKCPPIRLPELVEVP